MERWQHSFLREMPKAELHLHLDGALRVKTALELAQEQGLLLPGSYREAYEHMVVQGMPGSQRALLQYFRLPGQVLQTRAALRRAACELLEDCAADSIRYCEIRWAPLLHTVRGLRVPEVVEAVLEGVRTGSARTGVQAVCIAVAMRTAPLSDNLALLEELRPYWKYGLAGVDFAGVEAQQPDPVEQQAFFHRAREWGFHTTLHAGEIPESLPALRRAVQTLLPQRIAHGSVAAQDAELCAWLREQRIMLDLCPTSNLQAGLYDSYGQFPLRRLLDSGVRVSVSTDDPVLSDVSLSGEYARLLEAGQLTLQQAWCINLDALEAAFAPEAVLRPLRHAFRQWAQALPELAPQAEPPVR